MCTVSGGNQAADWPFAVVWIGSYRLAVKNKIQVKKKTEIKIKYKSKNEQKFKYYLDQIIL